ncbi:MAG: ribonuclease D [Acidobacteriota bacterium]
MIFIDQQEPFERAMTRVAAQPVIAVDTEADSLHSYFDKVCLIQLSTADDDLIVDPLKKLDLAPFGAVLADRSILKVLHGADYDLRILNRDFGYTISNLIDTSVAAQLLGYEGIGLAALLERHFGVKVDKSHQRADWAMRPLTRNMLEYAATDTRHLIALAEKLRAELEALGRWEWALEEFGRLENVRFEKEEVEEPFRRMKGLGALDRRALGIVQRLYDLRDALARKADRPPFKIFSNEIILETARLKPSTPVDLESVKVIPSSQRARYGRDIVRIVREALAIDENALPQKAEARAWMRDKTLESRVNKLKAARDKVVKELKIDPAVLAPRHVLTAVAEAGTLDVPAMREWQKRVVGEELLRALK